MLIKTMQVGSVILKVILMIAMGGTFVIAYHGVFESPAVELRAKGSKLSGKPSYYDQFVWMEYSFVAFAVLAFLASFTSSILICVGCGLKDEKNSKRFMIADIALLVASAACLVIGGSLLMIAAKGECKKHEEDDSVLGNKDMAKLLNEGDSSYRLDFLVDEDIFIKDAGPYRFEDRFKRSDELNSTKNIGGTWAEHWCKGSLNVKECTVFVCEDFWFTIYKSIAGGFCIFIAATGFLGPLALSFKLHQTKKPKSAGDVMGGGGGGNQEESGGAVETGSPQYQMYGAPPPPEYGGAYANATPQMSPSQNPAIGYPQGAYPQQDGYPQYAPQG